MVSGVKIFPNDGVVRITASGGEATLAFDFALYDETYIKILRVRSGTETELVLNTDYTVPLASIADEDGGLINLSPVAQAGDEYTLLLNVPYARETDFNQSGDFFADALNRELDLLTQQNQQIVRGLWQSLQYPDTFNVTSNALPVPVDDSALVFDGVTGAIKVGPTTTDIADAATNAATAVSAAAQAVAAAATVALNNYSATTAPTVNDDSGDGYSVGSRWVDTVTGKKYECADEMLGAAVWDEIVDTNDTQTLTNKTISGASNTISNVSLTTGVTGTLPVANGGTGAATLTANNVLLGNGTSAVQFVAPGTTGNVLTSNGTNWVSQAGGKVLQVVQNHSGTLATGTTQIPFDNTTPQNTEGNEYYTQSITPKSASSTLKIEVKMQLSSSGTQNTTVALFKDSGANALATSCNAQGIAGTSNGLQKQEITHFIAAGSTSAQTFKVRAGLASAGTLTVNGANGAAFMNGTFSSGITITEIGA